MSDINQIFLTAGLTVFSGFFVYVLGQAFVSFFLEPYRSYRELAGVIDHGLVYYADIIYNNSTNNIVHLLETRRVFRDFAGKFSSIYNALTFKERLLLSNLIPNPDEAAKVRRRLVYISNTAGDLSGERSLDNLLNAEKLIRELLKIPDRG